MTTRMQRQLRGGIRSRIPFLVLVAALALSLAVLPGIARAAAPFTFVTESAIYDATTQQVLFTVAFNQPPNFTMQVASGRQVHAFQYFIVGDPTLPGYERYDAIIRGAELHLSGDTLRIRNARPSVSDPGSGGWGAVRGTVPYHITGTVLTFSVPLDLLSDHSLDGSFTYSLETYEDGGLTKSVTSHSILDAAAPVITLTTAAHDTPASTGWYNQASSGTDGIQVTVVASDPAGITNLTCTEDGSTILLNTTTSQGVFTLGDGTHRIACTATDGVHNVGAAPGSTLMPTVYSIDQTAPALQPTVAPNPVTMQGTATASPNATDTGSGVAAASCPPVETSRVGTRLVTCTATDTAGNTATQAGSYTVTYDFSGFAAPVATNGMLNVAKAGQTVPLTWRLLDATGSPVTTLRSATVTVQSRTCSLGSTTDQIVEAAAGASGLQNLGDGYYKFNWKTPTSYAQSCKTMHLDLGEGATRTAVFQFTK